MTFLGYITIGLIIGWLSRLVTKDRGVTMWPSLGFGVLGAIAGTLIVQFLGLAGAAFYAAVGAIGVLFTVNVFRQEEPIFTNTKTI
tara:strand:- start:39854 stop:40111 length:258 start_codon:yes stop_codon:yes gene_type:complete